MAEHSSIGEVLKMIPEGRNIRSWGNDRGDERNLHHSER